ncbi:MAG: hypothetical protein MUO50_08695, partial [Longimicrobiales bacterium]|nr:hypothetical protein [Longimicrobiales bacterium]
PPDGAILYYWLGSTPSTPVVLEILDGDGSVIRRFGSDDPPKPPLEGQNVPEYWMRPEQRLSAEPGMHRFAWDLAYPPPAGARFGYPISAIYMNTPQVPTGPRVLPGRYTLRLTVEGRSYSQTLTVKMDPRVRTPAADLQQQFELSMGLYEGMARLVAAAEDDPSRSTAYMGLHGRLSSLYSVLQGSDGIPTSQAMSAVREVLAELEAMLGG